ncbi:MAG: AbrB/MazE/SpoVT family DNA-binding domain-containing protein [Betaproteobacteria bacterium]|nr:MAG: AbrB/MazE/SpoVT family DNA-binding domain-containing protein [Betaproteobacteria bacterium]
MTATAKVFMSGRSQAVRLPKEFRFDVDEVLIERTDNGILLRTKSQRELFEEFLAKRPHGDQPLVIERDTRPPERDATFWRAMFSEDESTEPAHAVTLRRSAKSKSKTK